MRRALLLVLGVVACRSTAGGRRSAGGQLEVRWDDGSRHLHFAAPARAEWCPLDTLVEIVAQRNDTAVGLILLGQDSIRAGGYPVYQAKLFTPWRPQASVALRLPGQTDIKGFESTSGQVTVTQGGTRQVTGNLEVRVRLAGRTDSLRLLGSFSGVAISPAGGPCGRADKPKPG